MDGALPSHLVTTLSRRARAARDLPPIVAFAVLGLQFGSWMALLPLCAPRVGASESQIGACMLAASFAGLLAMWTAGRSTDRHGETVLPVSLILIGVASPLLVLAGAPLWLGLAMAGSNFAAQCLNVSMNASVSRLEDHGVHRMPVAHAVFSAGMLAGSLATGAALAAGLPPVAVMVGVSFCAAAVGVSTLATRELRLPTQTAFHDREEPGCERPLDGAGRAASETRVLGALAALALAMEAGMNAWAPIHLRQTLQAAPEVAALAPGCVAAAMVVVRLALQARPATTSPWATIALGASGGTLGMLVLAAAPSPATGLLACVLAGGSLAVLCPVIYAEAARRGGHRRGAALAAVASTAWFGGMLAQSGLGFLAEATSLRLAIGSLALAGLAVLVVTARRAGFPARAWSMARPSEVVIALPSRRLT